MLCVVDGWWQMLYLPPTICYILMIGLVFRTVSAIRTICSSALNYQFKVQDLVPNAFHSTVDGG